MAVCAARATKAAGRAHRPHASHAARRATPAARRVVAVRAAEGDGDAVWLCAECGYKADAPPSAPCPSCGAPASAFEEKSKSELTTLYAAIAGLFVVVSLGGYAAIQLLSP